MMNRRPISEFREALAVYDLNDGAHEIQALSAALDELEQAREHVRMLREALANIKLNARDHWIADRASEALAATEPKVTP